MVSRLGRLNTCTARVELFGPETRGVAEKSAAARPSPSSILRMSSRTFLCILPVSSAISRLDMVRTAGALENPRHPVSWLGTSCKDESRVC
jgi:hypothetical protein